MKKIFTLILGLVATVTTFAQHPGGAPTSMRFIGDATIYANVMNGLMKDTIEVANDTIVFAMKSMTAGDVTIPTIKYDKLNKVIPAFTIAEAAFAMDAETHEVTFTNQPYTLEVTDPADGQPRTITVSSFQASYSRATNLFNVEVEFTYGSMPGVLTYKNSALYSREATGIERVELSESSDSPIYDLQGRRVTVMQRGGLYIQNGKKFVSK